MIETIAPTLLAALDRGDRRSPPRSIRALLDLRVPLVRAPVHVTTGGSP